MIFMPLHSELRIYLSSELKRDALSHRGLSTKFRSGSFWASQLIPQMEYNSLLRQVSRKLRPRYQRANYKFGANYFETYCSQTIISHLEEVFKRLKDANLKLKPSKCYFARTELDFLGHVVSGDGVRPNPKMVAAVQEFPVPKTVKQIRSFLGLSNYYRRFVKDYAKLASPLHKLTWKGEKFVWSDSCQVAFDKLKHALVSAPILAFPDFTKRFHVFTDASNEGIGMTLGQYQDDLERAIAYAGRDLNPVERNYSAIEKEALACVEAIKHFQPYLHGQKFILHTDHMALKWLMSIKDPTGRLAQWSSLLQQYDFEIRHRVGRVNTNPDALSRREYGTCTLNALHTPLGEGGL